MTAALALGGLFGLGLVTTWRLLRPPPPPLQAALDRLERTASTAPAERANALGRWAASTAHSLGLDVTHLEPDLRIVGRSIEQHLAAKALLAIVGALVPPAWAGLVAVGGVSVSLVTTLTAGLALAVGGFLVPDLLLRAEAAERRRDFVTALGSYLDLVVVSLAGGSGVEAALRDAAHVGHGWAFGRLRATVEASRLAGESPWQAFSRLGQELGVAPLGELAASLSLAGTEGARVRDSLAAKASALRDRQLSDAEAEAQSATERMAVPTVLLLAGFMVLIGYPAVDVVLTGL